MAGVECNGILIKDGVTYYATRNGLIKKGEEVGQEQPPILSFASQKAEVAPTIVPPEPPKEEKSWWQKLFGHKETPELTHPKNRNVLGCMQNRDADTRALADELGY